MREVAIMEGKMWPSVARRDGTVRGRVNAGLWSITR